MVASLGPVKFYGSSLPRPRFYTDVKFNSERVDPPAPVLDPLMSWAGDAHWSMGGHSFKRLRLQGRIEGNVKRLRDQHEKLEKKKSQLTESPSPIADSSKDAIIDRSPPPAPIANKRRRRFVAVIDEDEQEDAENDDDDFSIGKRWPIRKLHDEFDRVASDAVLESAKRPELDLNTVPIEKKPVRATRSSSSSPASRPRRSSRLVKSV